MEKKQIVTFWLLPAEGVRTFFSELITKLASRFEAPVFEPHVTIQVANNTSGDVEAILDKALTKQSPYRLFVRGLKYSDEFTRTLFVEFEPDARLAQLSDFLRRASVSPIDYRLNPHLSLLYKDLDTETKRELADSISLPFDEIVFDRVKAVVIPAEIRSRADVEAWRVIAERTLTT